MKTMNEGSVWTEIVWSEINMSKWWDESLALEIAYMQWHANENRFSIIDNTIENANISKDINDILQNFKGTSISLN